MFVVFKRLSDFESFVLKLQNSNFFRLAIGSLAIAAFQNLLWTLGFCLTKLVSPNLNFHNRCCLTLPSFFLKRGCCKPHSVLMDDPIWHFSQQFPTVGSAKNSTIFYKPNKWAYGFWYGLSCYSYVNDMASSKLFLHW